MITSKKRFSISNVTIAKVLAIAYIVVSKALVPLKIIGGIPAFILLLLLVIDALFIEHMKVRLDRFLWVELAFIAVTAATGLLFARNKALVTESLQVLIYVFAFCYAMFVIYKHERNINWLAYAWVVSALILVGYLFLTGGYSSKRIAQLSINESTNVNTLGVFFMFSVWFVLYLLNSRKTRALRTIAAIVCITLFLYYIYATASRKALIGSLFSIGFWMAFSMRPYLKRMKRGYKLLTLTAGVLLICFIYYRFGNAFSSISRSMTIRMGRLADSDLTSMHRFRLILDAIRVFFNNPVFGVGWNNYRLYSVLGQYSHNSFAEVLACTGVIGGFWGFWLWGLQFKSVLSMRKNGASRLTLCNAISLLIVLIFIDSVQIMYYNSTLLIIMHFLYIISTYYLTENQLNTEKKQSENKG